MFVFYFSGQRLFLSLHPVYLAKGTDDRLADSLPAERRYTTVSPTSSSTTTCSSPPSRRCMVQHTPGFRRHRPTRRHHTLHRLCCYSMDRRRPYLMEPLQHRRTAHHQPPRSMARQTKEESSTQSPEYLHYHPDLQGHPGRQRDNSDPTTSRRNSTTQTEKVQDHRQPHQHTERKTHQQHHRPHGLRRSSVTVTPSGLNRL